MVNVVDTLLVIFVGIILISGVVWLLLDWFFGD